MTNEELQPLTVTPRRMTKEDAQRVGLPFHDAPPGRRVFWVHMEQGVELVEDAEQPQPLTLYGLVVRESTDGGTERA